MIDGLIRGRNISYGRYEELLLRRDNVRKEAFIYQRNYTAEFGDLIISVFEKKIECIRKKKIIEFCQMAANHGRSIEQEQLQKYLQKEMEDFQMQLNNMVKDTASAKERGEVSEVELLQIKKIYHKMVKLIHPDINPMVADSDELQDLWQRVVIAYDCNQLKELQQLEILITSALEKTGIGKLDIDIPDIDEKIADLETEIKRIRENDPYMYKFLLENPTAVKEKKNSLKEELRSYEEYSNQLEEILQNLLGKGVSFIWRMN